MPVPGPQSVRARRQGQHVRVQRLQRVGARRPADRDAHVAGTLRPEHARGVGQSARCAAGLQGRRLEHVLRPVLLRLTDRAPTSDVWEVMSTARTIRRFTDELVDDATLTRCLEAATWAPSGANAQGWRFVVLRSPEQRAVVAKAAAQAL